MRTLAFFTQKGGSGKTTLAVHLAVSAHLSGERVAILGADPQGSAEAWSKQRFARGESDPPVATVTPSSILDAKSAAQSEGYTLLLLDAPPLADADAGRLLSVVDGVLIPVRPSAFDLSALHRTVAIIQSAGIPMACILNACPVRAPEISEAQGAISELGLPILATIHDRRAFSRAVSAGRAVMEFDPHGKAAEEIENLRRALQ